jgi:hypothetical protein
LIKLSIFDAPQFGFKGLTGLVESFKVRQCPFGGDHCGLAMFKAIISPMRGQPPTDRAADRGGIGVELRDAP